MVMIMAMVMVVAVVMIVIMMVLVPRMLNRRLGAHFAPSSPFIRTLSSSESELRIAVVLSSRIFL